MRSREFGHRESAMFVIPAGARSWVEVAPDSPFPVQNLPYGSFEVLDRDGRPERRTTGFAIGEHALDVQALGSDQRFAHLAELNAQVAQVRAGAQGNPGALRELRRAVFELLRHEAGALRDSAELRAACLIPLSRISSLAPISPRAFVDFYSGINHASNVGKMFRPDQPPLLPNYRHLPVGYNGRASSVIVSGTPVRRPRGQQKIGEEVVFGPTKELDFELEIGFFTLKGNAMGEPIAIESCEEHIMGLVLVNDWSARDVQRFEYVPLGPFLSKSFATSISPWVVSLDALEPFRIEGPPQDPRPLPHLRNPGPAAYDITLEVSLQTKMMSKPQVICRSNAKHLYWSFIQQLAHQTSNGTPIEPGDLYASGTISGTEEDSYGSMLELCWKGTRPLTMAETGEVRTWLEDGDTVTLTAYCQGEGYRIGFGECSGTVLPAG